jgi:site-specific DNA recombinase
MPDSATAPILRAAIYARVSSEEQREGQTIDSQLSELERFARDKGWLLNGVYKDDGWSGALLNRPALDSLRDDAARKKFDLVLLNDVDRLARDVAHLGIVKRDLERCGVKVVFRKLPSDESPTYNLMVNILGSFAEFEREMIADRTRRGRRHKVEVRQQYLGSLAAYGYRYVPKNKSSGTDGYLEVVPEEAALVRQMYEWVDSEGISTQQVITRLNQMQARSRNNRRWAKSTVRRILRNETYAGVWYYNKHYGCVPMRTGQQSKYRRALKNSNRLRPRSEWLPVILPAELRVVPRDLWQRVQQQLSKNITFSPRNSKHSYLLKGLVRCGGCGAAYVGDPCHGKYYYRCNNRCQRMPTVKEKSLDETVWGAVKEAVLNPDTILDQVNKLQVRNTEDETISNREVETIKRDLERIRKEESRLLEAYRIGIISPSQLGQELEQFRQRQSALEVRAVGLQNSNKASTVRNLKLCLEDFCQLAAKRLKTFTEAERQRFLRLLIDNVIFEGVQVRIKAVFPLNDHTFNFQPATRQTPELSPMYLRDNTLGNLPSYGNSLTEKSRTEDTAIYCHGRNPVAGKYQTEDTVIHLRDHNSARELDSDDFSYLSRNQGSEFRFELCKALPSRPFSILSDKGLNLVRRLRLGLDEPTLQDMCDRVREEKGVVVSLSHMSRALRRLNLATNRRGPRPKELKKVA